MTDWIRSGQVEFRTVTTPPQFVFANIKGGNNLMMPGHIKDYNLILKKLKEKGLSRNDLYHCASQVYETIELLHK